MVSANSEKWLYTHASGSVSVNAFSGVTEQHGVQKQLDILLVDGVVVNYTYNEAPAPQVRTRF